MREYASDCVEKNGKNERSEVLLHIYVVSNYRNAITYSIIFGCVYPTEITDRINKRDITGGVEGRIL